MLFRSALVPVDATNQALYGHSLGGLAVVHALFTEPKAFRSFIASSPSLWWDGNAVLEDEAGFGAEVRAGKIAPRILITAAFRAQPGRRAMFGREGGGEIHGAHMAEGTEGLGLANFAAVFRWLAIAGDHAFVAQGFMADSDHDRRSARDGVERNCAGGK